MKKQILKYILLLIFSISFFIFQKLNAQTALSNLELETKLNNRFYLIDEKDNMLYLWVNVKGNPIIYNKEKTPINVALVLDRSGSMSGAKLNYARKATKYIIDNLGKKDKLSIITYDHRVTLVSPSSYVKKKKKLKKQVDLIVHDGATNLSGGMFEGYAQVQKSYEMGYVNRVLLMSDGLANRGITDRFRLQDSVKHLNRINNITISTFGLGADFDEDLMEALADYGGANYYFIDKAEKIQSIFSKELQYVQSVIAQNVMLNVEFPTDVLNLEEVYAYPFLLHENQVSISFSDIFATEEKAVLLSFKINENATKDIKLNVSLTYNNIQEKEKTTFLQQKIEMKASSEQQEITAHKNKDVSKNIAIFKSNKLLSKAIYEADKGNYEQARFLTSESKETLAGLINNFPADSILLKQQALNDDYLYQIGHIERYNEYRTKMLQKNTKNENYKIRKRKE
ncbi:MAG: vWA domain-containing protein [Chitinophagales bacterium]